MQLFALCSHSCGGTALVLMDATKVPSQHSCQSLDNATHGPPQGAENKLPVNEASPLTDQIDAVQKGRS